MEERNFSNIFRKVYGQFYCPACGSKYVGDEIDSIKPHDEGYLVSISCRSCNLKLSMQVVTKGFSNFVHEELEEAKEITVDEIIGFHEKLKDFDGNFRKAFMPTIDQEDKIW
jgi:predicted RNA-binding Zn-ribbon protein involved in translation (DUF1610 family)